MVLTVPLPRGRSLNLGRSAGAFRIAWGRRHDPPADWFGDEGGAGVREPRRPRPGVSGGAIELEPDQR